MLEDDFSAKTLVVQQNENRALNHIPSRGIPRKHGVAGAADRGGSERCLAAIVRSNCWYCCQKYLMVLHEKRHSLKLGMRLNREL